MEIKALTSREDGCQNLVWLCGCQDKNGVRRRLLKCFEEGIGSVLSYHVDFVDDVDLIASHIWRIVHLFPELADFVDTPVAGGIYFDYVQGITFVHCLAQVAFVTGFALLWVEAIYCFGQDAGSAGLTAAAGPAEEIGMGDASSGDGVAQSPGYVFLTCYFRERSRAPLAVENMGGHDMDIILQAALLLKRLYSDSEPVL